MKRTSRIAKNNGYHKRILGINYNVFVLGLVSFFTDLSTEMILPLLPVFLVNELGATFAFVGLIEGLADGAKEIFRVPAGLISDKFRRRKIWVGIGYTISAATKPLLALSTLAGQVLGLRFLDRVGKGLRDAPRDALIGDSVQASERGRSFGYHRTMDTLGAVAGAASAVALISWFGFSNRQVFLIAGLAGLASVALIFIFIKEPRAKKRAKPLPWRRLVSMPKKFWWVILAIFIFSLGQFGSAFLVLQSHAFGLTTGFLPIIFIVFNIVHAMLATPVGIFSDRIGRKVPLILGWLVFAMLSAVLALSQELWVVWIAVVGYGLFMAFTDGVARAFITDLIKTEHRATALGIYGLSIGGGIFIANLAVGYLLDHTSAAWAFGYPIITSALAILVLLTFKMPKEKMASV